MKDLPLVSIMIPTYNQAAYIRKAIQSAIDQDYDFLEIVISDDCSTDDTESIIKPFLNNNNVRYFRNTNNLGRVGNYRYTLYERAKGDWVINLDGDDFFIDSNFISKAIEEVKKNEDVVFYQACSSVYENGKLTPKKMNINNHIEKMSGRDYFMNFFRIGTFSHASTLYNRNVALKTDFYSKKALNCDFESLMRLALKGNVVLCKDVVVAWRKHVFNETFLLDDKQLEIEKESFSQIYNSASLIIDRDICDLWLENANAQHTKNMVYLKLRSSEKMSIKLKLLFKHFTFDMFYFKELLKVMLNR